MPPLILVSAFLEGLSLTLIQGYLPLYLRQVLGEPSYVTLALVVSVPAIGTIVASNFWGGLSDVSGRLKPMVLVGLLGYAIVLAAIPLLGQGIGILVAVGTASLFYGTLAPSLKTFVTLAKPDRKEQALAFVLMSQSIGWFTGSVGGGWLLEGGIGAGLRAALGIASTLVAAHLVVCALRLTDMRREPLPQRDHGGWLDRVAKDLASLYENPRLLGLSIVSVLFVAGNYVMWGFFSVFMVEHLGASITVLRFALGISSLLGIVSFLFVGSLVRRIGGRPLLATGLTLYMVMYLGMSLSRNPVLAATFFAIPLYSMVNVSTHTLASEYSSASQRGGGLGVLQGAYALATLLGPVTGGLLADRIGLGAIPWLAFGFLTLAAPIAWVFAGRGKSARKAPGAL
jgi:predicted MFS family arabinose efflux permease